MRVKISFFLTRMPHILEAVMTYFNMTEMTSNTEAHCMPSDETQHVHSGLSNNLLL